jgi:murein DD-endopeptidase MepM/ murein hydrolase activator NlpD
MSNIYIYAGQTVKKGDVIGLSGKTAPKSAGNIGPHLHFEVLKQVPGSSGTKTDDYKVVDPYGWAGEGADPLESVTGVKNVRMWE